MNPERVIFVANLIAICICRSFPFRHKTYGRRVFKLFMQDELLRFDYSQFTGICTIISFYIKHVFNQTLI